MPPFVLEGEPASLLYLINLTAGLMDGDGHLVQVRARSGTAALLTGQSATRVHPALSGFASQQWSVEVEDDACLVVLPGPVIPYRGTRYFQRGRAELAPRARLIWGEIWFPGRYRRNELSERFVFEKIVQDFEVRRGGQLLYRDRFCWEGPWTDDEAAWFFGGHLAAGSLFVTGQIPEVPPLNTTLLRRSVFPLGSEDHCIRWCGDPSAVSTDLTHVALGLAGTWTGGVGAAPWLIDSSNLAPNHWFSTPPV
jgi:urease accessory protein